MLDEIPQLDEVDEVLDELVMPPSLEIYEAMLPYDNDVVAAAVARRALAGGGGSSAAEDVTFDPAGNISSTDVQAAIQELDVEKAASVHVHAGEDITSGTVADARIASTIARDSEVSSAISTSEAGQVRDGDPAGGVLAGTYPDPSFAADMATQAELDAHVNDTSAAHAASSVSFSATGTIAGTDVQTAVAEVATDAASALSAHESDTTNIHGITDTSALLTTSAAAAAYQPLDSDLTAIGGLSPSNDDVVQRKAGAWTNRTMAQLATDLALASTYQPLDSDLTALAGLSIASDTLPYGNGSHTMALATLTSYARTLLDDADAATARATLAIAGAIGGVEWTTVAKSADEDVSSSTTVQDDNHLSFSATSGALYEVFLVLIYLSAAGGTTPDLKIDLGEASGVGAFRSTGIATGDTLSNSGFIANQSQTLAYGTATTVRGAVLHGTHAGLGGTFKLRWAQNTSDSNATTMKIGSLLMYRRLN